MFTLEQVTGILVVGAGKMGGDAIAQFLEGGLNVFAYDQVSAVRESLKGRTLKTLQWIEQKRKDADKQRVHPCGFADEAIKRLTVLDSLEKNLVEPDFQIVFEAIFEDMKAKQELFDSIVGEVPTSCIFWTNTSSLNVLEMGRPAGIEEHLVGTHFMNPVHIMKGVEMVWTTEVDPEVFKLSAMVIEEKLGKFPFEVTNVSGFWVNKIFVPMALEAMRALERGEIDVPNGDKGLKVSLGHPQGIFQLCDQISIPTMYRVAMAMYIATQDPRLYPPSILARMFKSKKHGVATGSGFWNWQDGKQTTPVDFTNWQIKQSDTQLFA